MYAIRSYYDASAEGHQKSSNLARAQLFGKKYHSEQYGNERVDKIAKACLDNITGIYRPYIQQPVTSQKKARQRGQKHISSVAAYTFKRAQTAQQYDEGGSKKQGPDHIV